MKIDREAFSAFQLEMREREYSPATVGKYAKAIDMLLTFAGGEVTEKATLVAFKESLVAQKKAAGTVNGTLAAVNTYLDFCGYREWRLKFLRVQRRNFADPSRELKKNEYERLVHTARKEGDTRLALLLETMAATGVRVSEVQAITAESLRAGKAEIICKGKRRTIVLPGKLCKTLLKYCKNVNIASGPVFLSKTGRPLDRSNIWKSMKKLAARAGVALSKVFPHNLRHLFARTYYKMYKDLLRLADILGHSSIETTRIYTIRSFTEQRAQMEHLPLLL